MTSISAELSRINKKEYLDSLHSSDLAYWLINTFTPERYRAGERDVIYYACKILYEKSNDPILIAQLFDRLWRMHNVEPERANFMHDNVVYIRRRNKNAETSLL